MGSGGGRGYGLIKSFERLRKWGLHNSLVLKSLFNNLFDILTLKFANFLRTPFFYRTPSVAASVKSNYKHSLQNLRAF